MSNQNSDGVRDLGLWRTFLAAYRSGSVSSAARVLGMAQSSVTAHLQLLERSIGEPLFVRHPRGIMATARADELAARVGGPLDALAVAIAADSVQKDRSPVRLGGAAEFLAEVALPAVAPLIAGGLRIDVATGLAQDLLDDLRQGILDMVIAAERPRGRLLPTVALVDEEFALVASPMLGIDPMRVAEEEGAALSGHPLLAYARDVPILRRYWRHVFGVRLERTPTLTAPDLRALAAAAVAGAGVTVLPRYLIGEQLADGRLVVLHETDDPPTNTLYLVRRPGPLTEGVAAIEQALREAVADR